MISYRKKHLLFHVILICIENSFNTWDLLMKIGSWLDANFYQPLDTDIFCIGGFLIEFCILFPSPFNVYGSKTCLSYHWDQFCHVSSLFFLLTQLFLIQQTPSYKTALSGIKKNPYQREWWSLLRETSQQYFNILVHLKFGLTREVTFGWEWPYKRVLLWDFLQLDLYLNIMFMSSFILIMVTFTVPDLSFLLEI